MQKNAVLLAHGGITTLGANSFSMAIVGPIASVAIFKGMKKAKANDYFSVFVATAIGDLITYVVTSFQLATAFPAGNFSGELVKYLTIFAMTQVPIAIIEGLVSALIYDKVKEYDGGGLIYEKLN